MDENNRTKKMPAGRLCITNFNVNEKEMPILWLADKILSDLEGEDELKLTAIETAKPKLMNVNR